MDFQHRPGGKTGSGGVASSSESNRDRRERLRQLALETIDINKVGQPPCSRLWRGLGFPGQPWRGCQRLFVGLHPAWVVQPRVQMLPCCPEQPQLPSVHLREQTLCGSEPRVRMFCSVQNLLFRII